VLAAVTSAVETIAVVERDAPAPPGAGEVVLAPEAVGVCGSDYHFYLGELSDAAGGAQFPRIQGHEIGARIVALGSGCRPELEVGQRVAVWPLQACGHCYPCRVGRPNTCDHFRLIGIHDDGGLQQQLCTHQDQVFPINVEVPAVAALVEPLSIAIRAVNRARLTAGEHAVVLGAGPIGQCISISALERGAEVLVVDLRDSRLALARDLGAQTLAWSGREQVVGAAREWAGPDGPPVAFDATGAAEPVRAMVDMVASAGRAVQVGMSNAEAPIRIGSLTEKELDFLGVSCCGREDFGEATRLAERQAGPLARLVSHEFTLAHAPEALRFAIDNPGDVMKVVILSDQ
jgi:threonine dehydrogenase-like Zn-dependent dehydrogenase